MSPLLIKTPVKQFMMRHTCYAISHVPNLFPYVVLVPSAHANDRYVTYTGSEVSVIYG